LSYRQAYNTAQNSSENLPSYPPDNQHCSNAVYWRNRESYFVVDGIHICPWKGQTELQ